MLVAINSLPSDLVTLGLWGLAKDQNMAGKYFLLLLQTIPIIKGDKALNNDEVNRFIVSGSCHC